MTAVGELRAAAAKIRARAEEATPGPWKADHRDYPEIIYGGELLATNVISGSRWNGEASVFDNNDDAYHIALWSPVIALLVAKVLEAAATSAERECWADPEAFLPEELALARAINATEVA